MLTKFDLKKLALLGIIGGMAIGSPAFAEDEEEKPAEEPETEMNGCSGEHGCSGMEKASEEPEKELDGSDSLNKEEAK